MHQVYILRSQKLPTKLYIGLTTEVERRLAEHNRADVGYSRNYAPWALEAYVAFNNKDVAKNFEQYLKSGSGFAFLKKRLLPRI